MSEKYIPSDTTRINCYWSVTVACFIFAFFSTVPGCVSETTISYNNCVQNTSNGDKDRCSEGLN